MTWGGETQDVINAVAWLIFRSGETDGHSWLSLLQPSRQQVVDTQGGSLSVTATGAGTKRDKSWLVASCKHTFLDVWIGWISQKPVVFSFLPDSRWHCEKAETVWNLVGWQGRKT